MIVQISSVAISNIRWKTYIVFFALNAVFALVVFFLPGLSLQKKHLTLPFHSQTSTVPETSGRTLQETDLLYAGDYDKLFVVDKRGVLLPSFRSKTNHRVDEFESLDLSSQS